MNVAIPMPPWLRTVLIGAGLFMLGGVLSFGYSYRPLHGALTWKVDELEERINRAMAKHNYVIVPWPQHPH